MSQTAIAASQNAASNITSTNIVELKKGKGKSIFVPCDSYAHAVQICQDWMKGYYMKTGQWFMGNDWTGGRILHPTDGQIARISYNGRVWDNNNQEIKIA